MALISVDADMEDYGFEYSEEEPEEQDVDIENQYYNSKGTSVASNNLFENAFEELPIIDNFSECFNFFGGTLVRSIVLKGHISVVFVKG